MTTRSRRHSTSGLGRRKAGSRRAVVELQALAQVHDRAAFEPRLEADAVDEPAHQLDAATGLRVVDGVGMTVHGVVEARALVYDLEDAVFLVDARCDVVDLARLHMIGRSCTLR